LEWIGLDDTLLAKEIGATNPRRIRVVTSLAEGRVTGFAVMWAAIAKVFVALDEVILRKIEAIPRPTDTQRPYGAAETGFF